LQHLIDERVALKTTLKFFLKAIWLLVILMSISWLK
jgi:hypothetical protein